MQDNTKIIRRITFEESRIMTNIFLSRDVARSHKKGLSLVSLRGFTHDDEKKQPSEASPDMTNYFIATG